MNTITRTIFELRLPVLSIALYAILILIVCNTSRIGSLIKLIAVIIGFVLAIGIAFYSVLFAQ